MACFFVGSKSLSEPMRTLLVNPSEMYKFLFEIKIFAFAKTRLNYFNHLFFKDQWVGIIGLVNIFECDGEEVNQEKWPMV